MSGWISSGKAGSVCLQNRNAENLLPRDVRSVVWRPDAPLHFVRNLV
jgi:hypothetical protein